MFTCSLHFYASSNQYSQCFDSLCFIHIKAGSILNDIQQSIYLDDDLSEITPTLGAYQSQVSEFFFTKQQYQGVTCKRCVKKFN